MKRKLKIAVCGCLCFVVILTGAIAFAADYGSQSDPLITKSYLDDVFSSTINSEISAEVTKQVTAYSSAVDSKLSAAKAEIEKLMTDTGFAQKVSQNISASGEASTWTTVKVSSGKTLKTNIGTQIVLRAGTASGYSSGSVGLVNLTSGAATSNGTAIAKNNLYIATVENCGITASGGTATVLVLGTYTIA